MFQNRKSPLHNLRFLFFAVFLGTGVFFSGCASTPPPPPMPNFRPASVMTVNLPAPTTGTKRDIYHVVGPYESLWRIAIVYGKDMDSIMRDNQISDATKIKKGQKLLIRNTYGPRPNIPLYPTTRWTHIVIHHTATDVGNAYTIDSAHVNRGWERGMGYDFLIDNGTHGKSLGQIEVGPRWLKQIDGAHVKEADWNKKAIGIALMGNYSENPMPAPMMDNLVFLVATLKNFYRIPEQNIVGHRDVPGAATECPGKLFPWNEFKRRVRMY
ncbi:MAG: N-acetylmuramoyl-L-alanine amidase [Candidatus Omnitrophica bacterium ADurb.Bin292]|jgi:N-acetylmuramoyl-L-alanine amidase|nr:MAG: N-acetylmuramoyl-L-alanine amidase [Candidatus Omnitrophica bacterium ADurb.Bin292]HOG23316.1 N-acetylmuramoyl-L-alanine amidase [Candidatus Omnitrophota bacterium]HQB12445.1 N-acetylmuramoyl-L-alanine amidase [Candidatus Omnitrophota bacterium]